LSGNDANEADYNASNKTFLNVEIVALTNIYSPLCNTYNNASNDIRDLCCQK